MASRPLVRLLILLSGEADMSHGHQSPIHRYVSGAGYSAARGRSAAHESLKDARDWEQALAVVALDRDRPDW